IYRARVLASPAESVARLRSADCQRAGGTVRGGGAIVIRHRRPPGTPPALRPRRRFHFMSSFGSRRAPFWTLTATLCFECQQHGPGGELHLPTASPPQAIAGHGTGTTEPTGPPCQYAQCFVSAPSLYSFGIADPAISASSNSASAPAISASANAADVAVL